MALMPKVEPIQENKVVSARLDEDTHPTLQRCAAFLRNATHEYVIGESLKRLFGRDKEFRVSLDKNDPSPPETSPVTSAVKGTRRSVPSAA